MVRSGYGGGGVARQNFLRLALLSTPPAAAKKKKKAEARAGFPETENPFKYQNKPASVS
jgi:hypothetical protein